MGKVFVRGNCVLGGGRGDFVEGIVYVCASACVCAKLCVCVGV